MLGPLLRTPLPCLQLQFGPAYGGSAADLRTAVRQSALDEAPPARRYRGSQSTENLPYAVEQSPPLRAAARRSDRGNAVRQHRFHSDGDVLEDEHRYGALSRSATEGYQPPPLQRQMSEDMLCARCYRDPQSNSNQLFPDDEQLRQKKVVYYLPERLDAARHHRFHSAGDILEEEPVVQLRRKLRQAEQLERTSSLSRNVNGYRGSLTPQRTSSSRVSSIGDKMVLQMALPQRITQQSRPNSLPVSVDSYTASQRRTISASSSRQDLLPRSASRQSNDSAFLGSLVSTTDLAPTEQREKIRSFWYLLTIVLSSIYAVFLVSVGLLIYISDIFIDVSPVSEIFNIYLVCVGLLYFVFLYIDITCYTRKEKAKTCVSHESESVEYVEYVESPEGDLNVSVTLPSAKLAKNVEDMPEETTVHQYCFSQGRHSGSFYLKLGAAVFCFGHLTHYGLLIGSEFISLTSATDEIHSCTNVPMLVLDIIYPVYSFFQLFFIFKYSNVIINKLQILGRFALMHCIATSICLWMWTIMRETLLALNGYNSSSENYISVLESESPVANLFKKLRSVLMDVSLESSNNSGVNTFIDPYCSNYTGMSIIYQNVSPYLYPFSIEYSILIAGVLYIIWQNIGQCGTVTGGHCKLLMNPESSNLSIHVDCHSANKGLFAGIIVLLTSVVSIILFFVAVTDSNYVTIGVDVHMWTEFAILILMTVTVLFAYWQIITLDVNEHPISLLDDMLLAVCLPAYFFYAILSLYPSVVYSEIVFSIIILLRVLQVLIQTPFIIDGLRRCSNTRSLRQKKPGREVVTLLIVCNIALWMMQTFEIKSSGTKDHRYDFYGKSAWTVIGHLPIPLMMFYRFHSSVCLVDIWKSAYEPGE
ncbi:proton channel OtopLc-like [Schistocerca cancellata]|uniref:proton channel OtopLc-like n=1 Tax=Schistocerca cancellata TaxID=274614 RepID=UPI002117DFFA|nr:proton channel OtopLc-like [Schistocerca cancellata]